MRIKRIRLSVVREGSIPYGETEIRASAQAEEVFRAMLPSGDPREHLMALYLDGKNKPLACHVVSVGTVSASLVHPREVFAPAFQVAASSLIVAHNHPSGDPRPSAEDREVTKRLKEASKILGIILLDHLILGERGIYGGGATYSFAQEGGL